MEKIYRRTLNPKYDVNKVDLHFIESHLGIDVLL